MAFDPSTAQLAPETDPPISRGFDPSTAQLEEKPPEKPAKRDLIAEGIKQQEQSGHDLGQSVGRVTKAMGEGYLKGFDAMPPLIADPAQAELDRIQKGGGLPGTLANLLSLAAEDVHAPLAVIPGLIRGAQAGVQQAGAELGNERLGREIAGIPEAFPFGVGEMGAMGRAHGGAGPSTPEAPQPRWGVQAPLIEGPPTEPAAPAGPRGRVEPTFDKPSAPTTEGTPPPAPTPEAPPAGPRVDVSTDFGGGDVIEDKTPPGNRLAEAKSKIQQGVQIAQRHAEEIRELRAKGATPEMLAPAVQKQREQLQELQGYAERVRDMEGGTPAAPPAEPEGQRLLEGPKGTTRPWDVAEPGAEFLPDETPQPPAAAETPVAPAGKSPEPDPASPEAPAKPPAKPDVGTFQHQRTAGYDSNPDHPLAGRIEHLKELATSPDLNPREQRTVQRRVREFEQFNEVVAGLPVEQRAMARSLRPDDIIEGTDKDGRTIVGRVEGFDRSGGIGITDANGLDHTIHAKDLKDVRHVARGVPGVPAQQEDKKPDEPALPPAVTAYGGPWTPVMRDGAPAKNDAGDVVYENTNGVRATLDGDVPFTEATTETEKGLVPKNPAGRKTDHLIQGEGEPAPKSEEKPRRGERANIASTGTDSQTPIANLPGDEAGTKDASAKGQSVANIGAQNAASELKPTEAPPESTPAVPEANTDSKPSIEEAKPEAPKPRPGQVTREMLAEYFTPGEIVHGYGASRDKVIAFHPADDSGRWSVDVQQVERDGSLGRLRNHMTLPTMREVEQARKERGASKPAEEAPAPEPSAPATTPTVRDTVRKVEAGQMTVPSALRSIAGAASRGEATPEEVRLALDDLNVKADSPEWRGALAIFPPKPDLALAPEPEAPPSELTPQQRFDDADAAWRAYQPTFEKATADYREQKIGDDEYLKVRGEQERLRDAVDAAQEAIPDEEERAEQRRLDAGIEEVALDQAYAQADDPALEAQMDDIRDMLKNGWSPGDIAAQPGIDRTPGEIRALQHMWREKGQIPWETGGAEQPELPVNPKERYDALYPTDTPAATGKPSIKLITPSQAPTPASDGSGPSGPGSPASDLGQPAGGDVRTPRPGSRSGGRGGSGQGLAPQPTQDVPTPEPSGDTGKAGVRPPSEVAGGDEPLPGVGDATDGRPGAGGSGVDAPGTGGRPNPIELDMGDPGEIQEPTLYGRDVDLPPGRPNFFISEPERMVGGGDKARFNRNRRAIEAFQAVTEEGREPTGEELETMAGFTGWGSFGQDLFQGTFERPVPRQGWDVEGQWLREHLGKDAWNAAHNSISNAHYTDPPTVETMWNMVRQMGFNGGRVLEPSMGIGNFFGLMPRDLMAQSTLTGIELEPTTGGMAKLLYPQAGVFIKGFQESQTPDGFYDLVIGNWPFDATPPPDRKYNRLKPTLHDYFYLKALDQTRPGGLVVGITSAGTMDKVDRLVRMEMAKKGELLASFRLPSGAFEKYAGTKVVTDIMVLRKRTEPLTDAAAEPWIETKEMQTPGGTIRVNQYYHDHPENVLGTFDFGHGTTTFRPGMLVHRPPDLMERLQSLPSQLPTDGYQPKVRGGEPRFVTNNTADRNKSVVVGDDGNLYQVAGERLVRLDDIHKPMKSGTAKIQKQRADQVRDLVAMRKAYGALIDAERDGAPETPIIRKTLNDLYQAYTKADPKQRLVQTAGMKVLDRVGDPNWPTLAALQRPDGAPAAILSSPAVRGPRIAGNPSVSDAYVMARNESVNLDMNRIAELARRPVEDVEKSLLDAGAVFRTPGGGYEPSDGYLSGNVRRKLREAADAVERGEPMEGSVEALKKVIPPNTPYYQIEAKLGAPWVSDKDYRQFIAQNLLDLPEDRWPEVEVKFTGGKWSVDLPSRLTDSIEATQTHGHPRYRFDRLLTAALGNVTPRIMDPKDDAGGPYYNEKASEEVATRIQEVREKFQDWAWADAERTVRLEAAFNETMNAVAKPHFDGSFMDMSGMALTRGDSPFDLRKHQSAAIWRGVSLGRGAFFHEVGTGKTYTIGGIAIEGRRYGKWNKPLLFAHGANSKSVASEIQQMYPGAKILSIDSDDMTPKTLKASMQSIRNEDWDLVVVQHSHVNRFGLKRETLMGLAREQITAIEDEMYAAAEEDNVDLSMVDLNDDADIEKKIRSITAKNLAKQRLKILNNIEAQAQRSSREDAIPFEDLGVDAIFVDEAHVFKKPPIATRMRIKGLNTEASSQSIALDFLTKYVKNNNNGNGVFLFTGTPVTNSLNEIFNMSRYFMDDTLKQAGIGDWDTWFNTFADALNDVELVATGDYESIRRLSSFVNVDELVRVMSQFTDVVQAKDMPEFVDRATPDGKTLSSPDLTPEDRDFLENGRTENPAGRPYKRVINDVGEILPEQAIILDELRQEIRDFKDASPLWRKQNKHIPVVVEGNASRASIDARTYDGSLGENPNNKINRVTKNVLEIYKQPKAAQMIFVDSGYNPSKRNPNFTVVPDLIAKLVKGGIPREEIAIVGGGLEPDQKKAIADGMNSGKIRVAIGQSNTMGVGVNAQVNLRAGHHMDAPWMPGELEQRNGRFHRQGNSWNTTLEYRYITEGLDGKRWQVLTIKDRFIKQFISAFNDESGKRIGVIEGDAADVSEKEDIVGTLSAAAGDPRLLQKEKLKADVNRLERRQRTHTYGVADAADRARKLASSIESRQKTRAMREGHLNTWIDAQERMEKAAEEAGAKNRWYEATIDGKEVRTSADIQDALDKRVRELAQNEGEVKIGTMNGLGIVAEWGKGWSKPQYHLTGAGGETVDGVSALTVQRIVGRIQALKNDLEVNPNWREEMQSDIAKLQKAAQQPFTQGPALLKKRQQLAQIEDDMQENPIPPPAWLRHGAPIDTPIWVDGKERIVRGHRMKDDYTIVTDEGEVPYMKVTDQNGFNVFTQKPRPPKPPPKDLPTWAPPLIAKVEGAEVIWHKGGLVLVKAKEYGEDVYLGFKQGLTEDQQAWNVYGMRGAFDTKDIERMRTEADAYRDRERNRRELEKAQQQKPPPQPPSQLRLTADPATPWIKPPDPAVRDVLAEKDAETKALRRAADLRAWNWIKRQPRKPN